VLLRLLEIFLLGRAHNYAEARQGEVGPALRTLFRRFSTDSGTFKRAPFNVIVGYIWHVGFLAALLLFVPHIELFSSITGLRWPGLPNPVVDAITAVTIVALVAMLVHRLRQPVMRHISTPEAYHRLVNPYPLILGLHILSVEAFLVVFPFTKLMHAFTAFIARWYTGASFGRRGIES
jgi:nitrate reductase gamma subunit